MPRVQPSMTWTLTWQLTCLMTWHFFTAPGPWPTCYLLLDRWILELGRCHVNNDELEKKNKRKMLAWNNYIIYIANTHPLHASSRIHFSSIIYLTYLFFKDIYITCHNHIRITLQKNLTRISSFLSSFSTPFCCLLPSAFSLLLLLGNKCRNKGTETEQQGQGLNHHNMHLEKAIINYLPHV